MIRIWVEQIDSRWFAAALHERAFVATAAAATRAQAEHDVLRALPADAPRSFVEEPTDADRNAVRTLAELERGSEGGTSFELSSLYVAPSLAAVLRAAASIPIGFVATYGGIAAVSGSDARTVGRIMADNPLYPIVPCHRVVGSDFSLVGYGGSRRDTALQAKLRRLQAERRGFSEKAVVAAAGGLEVAPVEWAIARAMKDGVSSRQLTLW